MTQHEAFLLLTLPSATIHTTTGPAITGTLDVECITLTGHPTPPNGREVFLVLRLEGFELPLDPTRVVSLARNSNDDRVYTFHPCESDRWSVVLTFLVPGEKDGSAAQDWDTFDGILQQYADFRLESTHEHTPEPATAGPSSLPYAPYAPRLARHASGAYEVVNPDGKEAPDYRGRLVLVDESSGQVLGAVGDRQPTHADPTLAEHEDVVIDVSGGTPAAGADGTREIELDPREIFVRRIPPGEENYITKGASFISYGISGAASLITHGMSAASNYYVSKATPHPSASPHLSPAGTPPPPPPRAITLLTSDRAKRGMGVAHSATGRAVQVSGRTVRAVEGFVKRAVQKSMGGSHVEELGGTPAPSTHANHLVAPAFGRGAAGPYLSESPRGSDVTLPSYQDATSGQKPPPLPPRSGASTSGGDSKPPLPPRTPPPPGAKDGAQGPSDQPQLTPGQKLKNKARLVASVELILSTLDQSTKKILDVGSDSLSAAVGHKYGEKAGESARLMTGTMRNVGLVYVDLRGLGHRALLKTAGVEVVKTRLRDGREVRLRTEGGGGQEGRVVKAVEVDGEKR
ncbi:hypothetical protein PUNSTDRAFT_144466 [Punctularia strigosozonata HHB-11173 SS5]|uniref:uncharacterized protein n=1 Tax=Punctularia strigosozonata (strain HHB-11173) TaxID=741275 RepID=UPI0004418351|nr:uncharacterized protein PUNSTDRAFT_144466 [Punctularia strigosozonata HHB-11173 SS5]EIN08005.1 hypothetical protein PUNSTDRAFT_144466 [Punctularia strigosozonata HHB-11173 SS5]